MESGIYSTSLLVQAEYVECPKNLYLPSECYFPLGLSISLYILDVIITWANCADIFLGFYTLKSGT